jgi:hypothetical protein
MEEPITFSSSDYAIRADLESEIIRVCGNNIEANETAGHKISGTEADLKRLGLSLSTRIYGVKCEIIND